MGRDVQRRSLDCQLGHEQRPAVSASTDLKRRLEQLSAEGPEQAFHPKQLVGCEDHASFARVLTGRAGEMPEHTAVCRHLRPRTGHVARIAVQG